ncbi:MAG TPA: ABC transporter substrate-binding protein [Acetobacteraceae bacterium]|nr:ABC transporter substrate-binding protein [Acetobacteraceae bacterium]
MTLTLGRRGLLATAALAATQLARPAVAQTQTLRFTLPFVAQGATAFAFVARERGFFRARGLEAEIALGAGSPPAAQAIAAGQFDMGLVSAAALIQQAARGLSLTAVATCMYDATMAIAVPANSPIRTAKDLEGKRVGANPRGLDFAFWPAYARLAGVDTGRVTIQQLDPAVLERTLSQGQVDAVTCVAASSLPTFQSLNFPVRFLMWKDAGLQFYHNTVVTRPEVVANRAGLVEAATDALLEGLAFTLRDPEAALAAFVRQRPEIGISDAARNSARLGQGLMAVTVAMPEAVENGLGHTDMAKANRMIDTVMQYSVEGGTRPAVEALYSNRFAGRIRLTSAEWDAVRGRVAPFSQLLA